MLMGIFSAVGLCAVIFGSEIIDTVLSAKPAPNRTHPAFITFIALAFPGMIIGACGSLFALILPLHLWLKVPLDRGSQGTRSWLHQYAHAILEHTRAERDRPAAATPDDKKSPP
jgi:hypothetical protein